MICAPPFVPPDDVDMAWIHLKQATWTSHGCGRLTRTAPPPRQKKWIDYDERLQKVVENCDNYTILRYLKVVPKFDLIFEKCSILIIQYLHISTVSISICTFKIYLSAYSPQSAKGPFSDYIQTVRFSVSAYSMLSA